MKKNLVTVEETPTGGFEAVRSHRLRIPPCFFISCPMVGRIFNFKWGYFMFFLMRKEATGLRLKHGNICYVTPTVARCQS